MILRCEGPHRRPRFPFERCNGFIGAGPDGSVVLREVGRADEASPAHHVMRCDKCAKLWEVAPPVENAA